MTDGDLGKRQAGAGHAGSAARGFAPEVWRPATVAYVEQAADDMIAIGVRPEPPVPHRAGQYCELRFSGEELSRTYSIASSPSDPGMLEFGVQLLPTGIFSPRLAHCSPGDTLHLRGPLGQAFPWTPDLGDVLVLFGAGAGVTPLVGMYQHFVESYPAGTILFHLSANSPGRVFRYPRYRDVLATRFTGWNGPGLVAHAASSAHTAGVRSSDGGVQLRDGSRRIDFDYIREFLAPVLSRSSETNVRVCGPGAFINTVVDAVLELGFPADRVRAEGFA